MRYKNIYSAIHNFGDSFLSLMNHVDDGYVIDDLIAIHAEGKDIEINWSNVTFSPREEITPRIEKSLADYAANLAKHLQSQDVDINCVHDLKLCWPAGGRKYMWARDDRGKEYKIHVAEIK